MGDMMLEYETKFAVGQVVHHLKFDYRGVIVKVDRHFALSEEWYEQVARSRPPKDKPWYHVLVHGSEQATYVAERHLEIDDTGEPILHPRLSDFFDRFEDGFYSDTRTVN